MTSHADREDCRESYCPKPLTERLTKWLTEGSETIPERYTELNAEQFSQITTEKASDIVQKLSTDGQERSTQSTLNTSSK